MTTLAAIRETRVEQGANRVKCQRPTCGKTLGWLTTALFRRMGTGDVTEAPATLHVRCDCGFVNTLRLFVVLIPERSAL